jgi:hypothetical protein
MEEPRREPYAPDQDRVDARRDSATPFDRHGRAVRAFIAGYIQELSGRHNGRAPRARRDPKEALR